ncbi:MAG: RagB/SusD family nutrient uptake outer membrane protein [Dysgonomonas sp.]|nr:RagB/SusD family nutrient uptake outer membrane protein [Dysgonomonas sp.]
MKQHKFLVLLGLVLIYSLSSCSDYEDVPIEKYTGEYTFSPTDSIGTKALGYLNTIYSKMDNGHNRIGNEYLDTASDDAVTAESGSESDIYKLQIGRYNSTNRITGDMRWGEYYNGIRKVNTFVKNIDIVPLKEKFSNHAGSNIPLNRAWKAEARFLRAYFYFELVKRYGGVPIVDKIYELDDNIELPRNTFEECVDFIVDELDAIKDSLRSVPIQSPNSEGHIVTTQAAMALKSRVLLYAASPLFNSNPIKQNNPYIGYNSPDNERWKKAADAAKWFIDNYGGSLYSLAEDFKGVFVSHYGTEYASGKTNNEVIFYRSTGSNDTSLEKNSGPLGFSGNDQSNAYNSPTQNLVDAFPMLDGKPIKESTKYSYSNEMMYQNRDPRLSATVIHNGSEWLTKTMETYENGANNPTTSSRRTRTSYYLRKFMGYMEDKTTYAKTIHEWVMFRYAEILLNYAEAQNEYTGPSTEVYQIIKDLRKRAGIEPGDDNMYGLEQNMDQIQMREIIQNERRVEMAFEEHRYWDIRRWRIAEKIFQEPLNGLVIIRNGGVLEYNIIEVLNAPFIDNVSTERYRRYFYPIPYSEVIKNNNMIQNPGWE